MKATLGGRGMTIVALTVVLAGYETGYFFDVDLPVRGGNELRFLTEYCVTLATLNRAPLQCDVMEDQYSDDHARWRDEFAYPIRRVGTPSQDGEGYRVLFTGFSVVGSGTPYVMPVFRFARHDGSVGCLFLQVWCRTMAQSGREQEKKAISTSWLAHVGERRRGCAWSILRGRKVFAVAGGTRVPTRARLCTSIYLRFLKGHLWDCEARWRLGSALDT